MTSAVMRDSKKQFGMPCECSLRLMSGGAAFVLKQPITCDLWQAVLETHCRQHDVVYGYIEHMTILLPCQAHQYADGHCLMESVQTVPSSCHTSGSRHTCIDSVAERQVISQQVTQGSRHPKEAQSCTTCKDRSHVQSQHCPPEAPCLAW